MQKFSMFIILFFIFAGIFGWHRANTELQDVSSQPDNWNMLYNKTSIEFNTDMLAQNLKTHSLFPNKYEENIALPSGTNVSNTQEDSELPRFPKIVSAAYRDNQPIVILRNIDSDLFTATPGDILDSGWQIEIVNMEHVIAVFEGEEQIFSVAPYDLSKDDEVSHGSRDK